MKGLKKIDFGQMVYLRHLIDLHRVLKLKISIEKNMKLQMKRKEENINTSKGVRAGACSYI